MEINFKQHEITEAMKQYVARRFNIDGQSFNAEFRMGKGKNALTVLVTVEDVAIPGYTGAAADDEDPKTVPAVATTTSTATVAGTESSATVNAEETSRPGTVGASIVENVKEVAATTAQADKAADVAPAAKTVVEPKADAPAADTSAPEVAEAGIFD